MGFCITNAEEAISKRGGDAPGGRRLEEARGLRWKSKISLLAAYVMLELTRSTNSKVDFQPSLLPRASPPSPNHCNFNFNTNLRGSEAQSCRLSISACRLLVARSPLPYLATIRILATLTTCTPRLEGKIFTKAKLLLSIGPIHIHGLKKTH